MSKWSEQEEIRRIQTLLSYNILDTPYEEDFNGMALLISNICETPVALISVIDERRQWHKAKVGVEMNEVPREETICQHTILQDELLEIEDTKLDERVKDNPHVKAADGVRFYAGMPLTASNGYNIGSVCVVDIKPRKLKPHQKEALKLLTNQVMLLLEARKKNADLGKELDKILDRKIEDVEKRLFSKEVAYNNLLKAVKRSSGVVEFSPTGTIKKVNEIFLQSLGYEKEELVGIHHNLLLDEDQRLKNAEFWESLSKGSYKAGRFKRRHKNGKEVWFQATYNPIFSLKNKVLRVIKISQDITAEIEAEQTLIKAKEIAEILSRQKDNFIANVSHEIRTPLHAVLGFTDLLLTQETESDKKSHLESIKSAGDTLLYIINDILDLSKLDSGAIQFDASPFELKHLLKNVFSILKLKAEQKGLELNYFLQGGIPHVLLGDQNRLTQILLNLLGNSIKFTATGSVELFISKKQDTDNAVKLEFKVVDTGIGIPEEKLESIFGRFSQADESISRKYGGTGLGLNITKQLVERQGGTITAHSVLEKGSQFIFTIPFKIAENVGHQLGEIRQKRENSGKKGAILLCEDNELNQRLIKATLQEKGHQIDIADNGRIGLEMFAQKEYDLVLMDMQMPELDGHQTTQVIREEIGSDVPIVALTANFLNSEKQKCLEEGMNAYISKPFTKEELENIIDQCLSAERKIERADKLLNENEKEEGNLIALENLEQLSGGNKTFEKEMMQLFIVKAKKLYLEMEEFFKNENYDAIKTSAHKMKTSFGIIGADIGILSTLENKTSETQDVSIIKNSLYELKEQLNKIISILKNKIESPT